MKWLYDAGAVLLTTAAAAALLLVLCFAVHRLCLRLEAGKIKDYGRRFKVFDGEMNVLVTGKGEAPLVLLPGYGTASPGLDFSPLIRELEKDWRVFVIEPFGYGLSSQTARDRTAQNIAEEVHCVIGQLGLQSFVLAGHSIAGIYALHYLSRYPLKVRAFVGIDTSVPEQPFPGFSDGPIVFLARSGLLRMMRKIMPKAFALRGFDAETARQIGFLQMKNMSNPTVRREGRCLTGSFSSSRELRFPADLPVLLFVAPQESTAVENWHALHEEQIEGLSRAKLVKLPGQHYLHHTASREMAQEIKCFL